jgi:hypothetical protein
MKSGNFISYIVAEIQHLSLFIFLIRALFYDFLLFFLTIEVAYCHGDDILLDQMANHGFVISGCFYHSK